MACSLDVFGDRWTLLIVPAPFFSHARASKISPLQLEGIPTNILADRLERSLAHGVVEQIPAEDGTKRLAYRLTEKGKALGLVLKAVRDWGLAWDKSTCVRCFNLTLEGFWLNEFFPAQLLQM